MRYQRTTSHSNASTLSSTLRRIAAAIGVALLLAVLAPSAATAQQAAPATDEAPRWTKTFAQQAEKLLESDNPDMQAQALQLIVEFGERPAHAFNLDSVRPELYTILLDHKQADNLRILALSALNATGPSPSIKMLAESVQDEPSPRVRRFMLLTLHSNR